MKRGYVRLFLISSLALRPALMDAATTASLKIYATCNAGTPGSPSATASVSVTATCTAGTPGSPAATASLSIVGRVARPTWSSPSGTDTTTAGFTLNPRPKLWFWHRDANASDIADAQIDIADDSGFATNLVSYQYSVSGTGWSPALPVANGTTIYYTPQSDWTKIIHYLRVKTSDGTNWTPWTALKIEVKNWSWTDAVISTGVTQVKAAHLNQLRDVITNVSAFRGLTPSWTDATISTSATLVRKVHLTDMRANLDNALSQVGESATWTDATINPGVTPVRAIHFSELRNKAARP